MGVGASIIRTAVLAAALGLWLVSASAWAQTTDGAFAKLSPGEQKIASALFEAQTRRTAPGAPRPLTLDQIAARKQGHEGWGEVFKDMKSQGVIADKNLGQVVSRFEEQHREAPGAVAGRTREETDKGIVSGSGRGNEGGMSSATTRGDASGGSSASQGTRGGGGGVGHGGGGRR